MMLPTHALLGMLLALPVAVLAPDVAGLALLAGLVGGVLPDLDLYVGHRRTLHFPVYYTLTAAGAIAMVAIWPRPLTIAVSLVALGAAVHSVADVFGGGLELRPWEATSDRAVYDHYRGRWIAPRRWIRYDGAPEDLVLAGVFAVPLWLAVDGSLAWVVVAALAVGSVYTAVRRILPELAGPLLARVPDTLVNRVPARYLESVGA